MLRHFERAERLKVNPQSYVVQPGVKNAMENSVAGDPGGSNSSTLRLKADSHQGRMDGRIDRTNW